MDIIRASAQLPLSSFWRHLVRSFLPTQISIFMYQVTLIYHALRYLAELLNTAFLAIDHDYADILIMWFQFAPFLVIVNLMGFRRSPL